MRLFDWLADRRLPRELDDPRRHGIVCTHHAQEQAGQRYGRGGQWAIIGDVVEALEESRIGRRSPSIPVQKARRGARLAWAEDCSRIYVIYQRKRTWFILTAVPTDETAAAAVPAPVFWPSQGLPAVAAALERARETTDFAR